MPNPIRIGTRASKLALAQAEMLCNALRGAHPHLTFEIVAMTTAGDRELHKKITDWGYKGLFTKELEDALIDQRIDMAVHSMKDMPSMLPHGLMIGAVLPRADVRDAWVSVHHASIGALPQGAMVGTSSARRAAQLLHQRPDIRIVELRGNVQTRLKKIEDGVAQATLLAASGLMRLGLENEIRTLLAVDAILPAVAQGAIGVECAEAREDLRALLSSVNHAPTHTCITAERAMLLALDGSCRTPIAGLAELRDDGLFIQGEVLSLDGTIRHHHTLSASAADAAALGKTLGNELRAMAGDALLTHG
jgi:hydroxymethylbilane synthase